MNLSHDFPEAELNALAARHGLGTPIHFHFDAPDLTGYEWIAWLGKLAAWLRLNPKGAYNHHTKKIFIAPKLLRPNSRLAFYTAHEVGHAVTLRNWPLWIHDLLYWPVILGVPVAVSMLIAWWLFVPVMIGTYLLHPFELMANAYAHQHNAEFAFILAEAGLG